MTLTEAEQAVIRAAIAYHSGECGEKMLRNAVDTLLALRLADAGGDSVRAIRVALLDEVEDERGQTLPVALAVVRRKYGICGGCGSRPCCALWSQQRKCCPDCTCEPVPEQSKAEESDNG